MDTHRMNLTDRITGRINNLKRVGAPTIYALSPVSAEAFSEKYSRAGKDARGTLGTLFAELFREPYQKARKRYSVVNPDCVLPDWEDVAEDLELVAVDAMECVLEAIRSPLHDRIHVLQTSTILNPDTIDSRAEAGLYLLSRARQVPDTQSFDAGFWDLLTECFIWNCMKYFISKMSGPSDVQDEGRCPPSLWDLLNSGFSLGARLDLDLVDRQLRGWEHLRRKGVILPLPLPFGQLLDFLLNDPRSGSLVLRIHEAAMSLLVGDGDGLPVLWMGPEYAVSLQEIAAASLAAWLQTYETEIPEGWDSSQKLLLGSLLSAISLTLCRIGKDRERTRRGVPERESKEYERGLNRPEFVEVRRLFVQGCQEQGVAVPAFDGDEPLWVHTLLNFMADRNQRKSTGFYFPPGASVRPQDALFIDEAAEELGVGVSTIRRWIRTSEILPKRLGRGPGEQRGQYFFLHEDMEDLRLLSHTNDTLAEALGTSVPAIRRKKTILRKTHPGIGRLDLLKALVATA